MAYKASKRRVSKNKRTGRPSFDGRLNGMKDVTYFKPKQHKDYLTITELAYFVGVDTSWIKVLEKTQRIPKAHRIKRGQLQIRLWSPEQAEEVKRIISTHRPGRPKQEQRYG